MCVWGGHTAPQRQFSLRPLTFAPPGRSFCKSDSTRAFSVSDLLSELSSSFALNRTPPAPPSCGLGLERREPLLAGAGNASCMNLSELNVHYVEIPLVHPAPCVPVQPNPLHADLTAQFDVHGAANAVHAGRCDVFPCHRFACSNRQSWQAMEGAPAANAGRWAVAMRVAPALPPEWGRWGRPPASRQAFTVAARARTRGELTRRQN
jgi:hypothetical protein